VIKFLTWRNLSIREKLILISFITTGSALFLVGTIFIAGEIFSIHQSSVTYLSGLAKTVSQNSIPALKSQDKKGIDKIFGALNSTLDVTCAVLYDVKGNVISKFDRGAPCQTITLPLPKGETHRFGLSHMELSQEVKYGQEDLGTIQMVAYLGGSYSRITSHMTTLFVIMGCSFLFGYILFSNLQNTVTRHIYELASLMKIISANKDYSIRATTVTKDEIGTLAEGFNEMLDNIENRDIELANYRQGLEDLVDQRTKELISANEQLQKELAERIKIEKALQESEYRYRTIFETSGNANFIVEEDMTISMVNAAFERLSGFSRGEIENRKTFLEFVEKDDLDRIKSYHIARKENSKSAPSEYECRLVNREGSLRDVYASASLIPGTTRSIASLIDVTDLRKLQGQLLHSQKMEAVGQLAGGVAHDFNNILTIIMGYGSILLMNTAKDSTLKSYVESILASAERATNLTQSLLAFSRKQSITPKNIELNSVIKNVEKLLRRLIGEDIELQTKLSKTVVPVFADPGQIEQILINLAANARDAMPQGGSLQIHTEVINEDEVFSKNIANYKPGKYALISVADTGMGMSQETAERIFEPFFTTKEEGKGTGLGLSIVHGVIIQHSGHIEVQSEPGHGTIFRMYLPLAAYKRERAGVPVTHRSQGGSETVLVAEDNEPVRILVRNILSEYGYTVVESGDGEKAVEKFRDPANHVHLLLLDVILPKVDGKSVYEEIRKIKPDIKVLFMSGYTTDIVQNHGIFENEFNFIQKPVMPHVLLSKIRNVLDTN
jgi:PAS domain S-box-containing protein